MRLLVAAGIGAALGLEREWRDHEAGVRTHLLVCLGSALFTLVGAYGFSDFRTATWDPTRISAQIVTGIGFLGAGTILRVGLGVRGLTTAANLWVAAAAGLAAGVGEYMMAILGAGIAIVALGPFRFATGMTIGRWAHRRSPLMLEVVPENGSTVVDTLKRLGGQIRHLEVEHSDDRSILIVWVDRADATLAAELSSLPGVTRATWDR